MSVHDLRTMITGIVSDVVEEKLARFVDPDAGLELRDDFVERLLRQEEAVKNGERGIGLDELLTNLGIDRAEIEAEKNVPVTIS